MTDHVVIGDGAAGTTAAHYIRRHDPNGRITIFSDDPNAAYYRAALTNYLIGELREEQLFAVPPDFYTRLKIQRSLARVAAVDTANRRLVLASGGPPVAYDQLCIAAGSSPNPPPFPGAELSGVMTMRTMQDARTFMEDLRSGRVKRAVVIGGGPLALEWAQGLRARGAQVTYILRGREFMGGVLDQTGSDLVASRLRAFGCDLRMDEEVVEVIGDRHRRVKGVKLKGGAKVDCELVCAAIGIRMNTGFLQDSGIAIDRGIPVDEHMRTNLPNVYAAGDVAEVFDPLIEGMRGLGLWEPARLQGRVAGINMTGGNSVYRVGVTYNATRLYDLDFAGVGRTIEQDGDRVYVDLPRGKGTIAYRKLVVRDGRLVGAILMGHRAEKVRRHGLRLQKLVEDRIDVSQVADELLDPGFDLPAWMAAQRGDELHASRELAMAGAVPTYSRLLRTPDLASPLSRMMARPTQMDAPPLMASDPGATMMTPVATAPQGETMMAPVATPERPGAAPPEPPAPPRPAGSLAVEGEEREVDLGDIVRIGRRSENELVLADPIVSGSHAEIRRIDDAFVLADAGSRNGTFLNDEQVMAPTALSDGDVIRVGDTRLRVALAAPPAPPAPPAPQPAPPAAPPAEMTAIGPAVSGLFVRPEDVGAPDPAAAAAVLGVLDVQGRRVELRGSAISIGREPKAEVPVADPAVSSTHAQIIVHEGNLYLRDLGSRNGTFVNVQLVTVPHLLRQGDVIHVGDTDITFHATSAAPAPVAPIAPPEPAAPPARPPTQVMTLPREPTRVMAQTPATTFRLTVESGPFVGLAFKLTPPSVSVGRNPDADIAISDATVSWEHCRLTPHGAAWTAMDLGSTNGTKIDGQPLEANRETPIDPGAALQLGEVLLRFEEVTG